jgi:FAD/FMN-containing dehydrogenase
VTLQLERVPSPWIYSETYRISGLDELLVRIKEEGKRWPMTVAWVDTVARGKSMGRGILFVGRWATPEEAPNKPPKAPATVTMPITLPSGLLNRFTMGLFNKVLYTSHIPRTKRGFIGPDEFFYPLDRIRHWNRIYGSRGVTQHQSVIPEAAGVGGIRRMIEELAAAKTASFLTVVKDCGQEGEGLLSFPMPGMSLALDLPITKTSRDVVSHLNHIVQQTGGRIYLTKDGLSTAEDFQKMEPRLAEFERVRANWDPEGKLRSAQSKRLMGH